MQNAPYSFFYERRYKTSEMIDEYIGELSKQDKQQMLEQIGGYLYLFRVVDRLSSWTVLKTLQEVNKLLFSKYNEGKLVKVEVGNLHNTFLDQEYQLDQLRINDKQKDIPSYMVKFFEIYHTNVKKISSFVMFKKIRGLTAIKRFQNWLCGAEWQPKRIIITEQGVLQMATQQGVVTDFLKFDLYFSVQSGMQATGKQFGIALYSAHRKVVLKVENIKHFIEFLFYVIPASQKNNKKIRFGGSCRPRTYNNINFLVDAEDYFRQVALSLQKAKKQVFMCGWWISPELYLIRPLNNKGQEVPQQAKNQIELQYRLDILLKRIAEKGVKIYIVIFYSPSVIPNDSDYTKLKFVSLHPNIVVERHPHEFLPKLWSHHEKVVIIDQKIAFMGGLDLCYGRYDSCKHPVNTNDSKWYPGIDYNNVRIKDFFEVRNFQKDLQDRNLPRMPWHDVAFKVIGKIVADVTNHFIQYWNFTLLQKSIKPFVSKESVNLQQTKQVLQVNRSKATDDLIRAIFNTALRQNQELNNKQKQTMQKHIQNKGATQKLKKRLQQERRHHKLQLNNGPGELCLVLSIQTLKLLKVDTKQNKKVPKQMNDQVQLLRSASEWSIGLENGVTQRSIQNAYLQLIYEAKHFIYIQNQFFISGTGENEKSYVKNQIANSLYERIQRAVLANEKFKVMIFMPLLPGMEGQLGQKCPLSLKLTMYWQFNTIYRNEYSLIQRVKRITDKPQDYIQFFSLRNHGILDSKPVTQIIYIHTKLMIVDDDIVLCGSANINDRSQEGSRDSELAVIFTSGEKVKKRMNGQYKEVNEKAHKLREKLFRQHFGLTAIEAEDPLSEKTIDLINKRVELNTDTYRNLFGCCPDDNVQKLEQVGKFEKKTTLESYLQQCHKIKGHAVRFPYKFLSKQKLYKYDLDMIQDIFT